MPLLEVTQVKKLIATVSLEESTAKQVDQYRRLHQSAGR